MKRLLFSFVLVGILLGTNVVPATTWADGSTFRYNNIDQGVTPNPRASVRKNIRQKITSACTALLVTSTIALSGFYTYTGQLHERGLGARVVWAPERRAIVVLLLRALKLPAGNTSGGVVREVAFASRDFAPEDYTNVTADELDDAMQVSEFTSEKSAGVVMLKNQPFAFELFRQSASGVQFMIRSL